MGKTFTTSRAVDGGKGTMISVFWLNKSIFLTVHFARDVGVHKLFPQFFILLQSLRCFNLPPVVKFNTTHQPDASSREVALLKTEAPSDMDARVWNE